MSDISIEEMTWDDLMTLRRIIAKHTVRSRCTPGKSLRKMRRNMWRWRAGA